MASGRASISGGGGNFLERQVVTWAAGITAAAAIGYIVLGSYVPTFGWTSGKIDKDVVPGLYNRYGNDCFANCVIQVSSPFYKRSGVDDVEFGGNTIVSRVLAGTG